MGILQYLFYMQANILRNVLLKILILFKMYTLHYIIFCLFHKLPSTKNKEINYI